MKPWVVAVLLGFACSAPSAEQPSQRALPASGSAAPATPLHPPAHTARIRVAFVLSNDAQVVDFAGPWGVFEYTQVPGYQGSPFELYTVAERAEPVRVSGGMMIVPTHTFADAPAPNLIVVPAQDQPPPAALAWLRRMASQTDLTMSVCTGAFVLAEAGLLDGKAATTHHEAYAALAKMYPAVQVQRGARFVDSDGLSTAGGLTSGIDLALHVVERYYGREAAERTTQMLEYQGQGWKDARSNATFASQPTPTATADHPLCPICDMQVELSSTHEFYRGNAYYFCSKQH